MRSDRVVDAEHLQELPANVLAELHFHEVMQVGTLKVREYFNLVVQLHRVLFSAASLNNLENLGQHRRLKMSA